MRALGPLADPALHLRLVGLLLTAVGLAHLALPRALGWGGEMRRLSLVNRQVAYVHAFFIGLACVQFGLLAWLGAGQLLAGSPLARGVLLAAAVFWGCRLGAQLVVFDPALWRGRRLTVLGHVAFVVLWAYVTGVFTWPLLPQ